MSLFLDWYAAADDRKLLETLGRTISGGSFELDQLMRGWSCCPVESDTFYYHFDLEAVKRRQQDKNEEESKVIFETKNDEQACYMDHQGDANLEAE